MRLRKLKLRNFRCFGDEVTTIDFDDLTALVGANSSGKTAVMSALAKLFSPDPKERLLERSDFHLPRGRRPQDGPNSEMMIEAVFSFPELKEEESTGLARLTVPEVFNQMQIESNGEMILRIRLTATWSKGVTPEGEIDQVLEFILTPEGEKEATEQRKKVTAQQRSLIQFIYVPAVRDPLSQLRLHAGALLKRLFDAIEWSQELPENLAKQTAALQGLFNREVGFKQIEALMSNEWKRYQNEARFSEVSMSFTPSELSDLLKKVEVTFKPTFEEKNYTVDQLGDGLRSMFYLSLVSTVITLENRLATGQFQPNTAGLKETREQLPALTILGIEEPENHLSPQMLGKVMNNLMEIAKQPNANVVISSHSPAIMRRISPTKVRHLRIDRKTDTAIVRKIKLPKNKDKAYKYVKEAVQAYPELYFAKVVILGEGDSEEDVIPRVLEAFGCQLDREELALVPLGGRHVNHFWRLLKDLDIPYVTLLDFDQERYGGGWARITYALEQLLECGVSESELLAYENGKKRKCVLTRQDIAAFPSTRGYTERKDLKDLEFWLQRLRDHDVFFSTPLDLDFMMLAHFFDTYKATVNKGEGPRIPAESDPNYDTYMKEALRAVLKDRGGNGSSFSRYNKELFPWYRYLFLGKRGKPVTHRLALKKISPEELMTNLPEPLQALATRVQQLVRGRSADAFES